MIELEAADVYLTVHPEHGGRLGALEVGQRSLLATDRTAGPMLWGCYPMAPWAGRVRNGRFRFDGRDERLPQVATDVLHGHALHGTVHDAAWEVLDAGRSHCEMQRPLDWQYGGFAHQHVQLTPLALTCLLTVSAAGRPMPAVLGWHPCFVAPTRHDLAFARMYRRDFDGIALGELVPPPSPPWDDCFIEPLGPLRLHYERSGSQDSASGDLEVTITSDCEHWVVFDGVDDILCVEPQSGPPDAFSIGGAVRLEPGEMLQRYMTISWRDW